MATLSVHIQFFNIHQMLGLCLLYCLLNKASGILCNQKAWPFLLVSVCHLSQSWALWCHYAVACWEQWTQLVMILQSLQVVSILLPCLGALLQCRNLNLLTLCFHVVQVPPDQLTSSVFWVLNIICAEIMIHYSGIKQYMLVNGWNGPNYVQEQSLVRFLDHILVFVFKLLLSSCLGSHASIACFQLLS